jgi:hypothetical protein
MCKSNNSCNLLPTKKGILLAYNETSIISLHLLFLYIQNSESRSNIQSITTEVVSETYGRTEANRASNIGFRAAITCEFRHSLVSKSEEATWYIWIEIGLLTKWYLRQTKIWLVELWYRIHANRNRNTFYLLLLSIVWIERGCSLKNDPERAVSIVLKGASRHYMMRGTQMSNDIPFVFFNFFTVRRLSTNSLLIFRNLD